MYNGSINRCRASAPQTKQKTAQGDTHTHTHTHTLLCHSPHPSPGSVYTANLFISLPPPALINDPSPTHTQALNIHWSGGAVGLGQLWAAVHADSGSHWHISHAKSCHTHAHTHTVSAKYCRGVYSPVVSSPPYGCRLSITHPYAILWLSLHCIFPHLCPISLVTVSFFLSHCCLSLLCLIFFSCFISLIFTSYFLDLP